MDTSTAGTGLPDRVLGGRYELGDAIGRGGSATVYRGRDRATGRAVAVKVLGPAVGGPARRREREMELLSRLDHFGLVAVLDTGVADQERPFLVMELVDGLTLAACRDRGPLPAAQVARIGRELGRALAHVHSHGITHRDVSPANVLLDGTGRARLTDFGIALLVDQTRITATGAVIGTAAYMSPEQVCGEPVGPPTDVYALGLVLLEAVTGRVAYSGTGKEVAIARLARRPEIPPDLSGPLAALLPAMTADRPDDRPTAAEVASALDGDDHRTMMVIVPSPRSPGPVPAGHRTAVGPPVPVPPGSATGSGGSRLRRRPVLAVAGLLVAAGLAGGGAWSLTGSVPDEGRALSPVAAPPVGSLLPPPTVVPEPVRATVPSPVPVARETPAAAPATPVEPPRDTARPSTREAAAPGNRATGDRGAEKGDKTADRDRGGSKKGKGNGDAGKGRGHDD